MAILHREDKEIEQVEKEMLPQSLEDARGAVQALDEVMRKITQSEAYQEANRLVEALEKGNLVEW